MNLTPDLISFFKYLLAHSFFYGYFFDARKNTHKYINSIYFLIRSFISFQSMRKNYKALIFVSLYGLLFQIFEPKILYFCQFYGKKVCFLNYLAVFYTILSFLRAFKYSPKKVKKPVIFDERMAIFSHF